MEVCSLFLMARQMGQDCLLVWIWGIISSLCQIGLAVSARGLCP